MQDNKIMRPRFKWFVALLLVCAMMVAFIPSLAGLNFTPDPLAPDLKIVSTLTDGGKYLEVGLNVDSKDGTFQSAGVLLSYDPAMLTPIIWGEVTQEDGTAIDGAVLSPGQATSAESAWSDAIVLPTKGADELSGKLAKAVEWEGTGYLYISAEAAETMEKLNQELPTTTEEEPETELPQPTPGTDEPATQEDTGDTTEPTDPETPATPERQSATASGMTISYIDEATAPTEQATIVRFRVNEKLAAATEGAEATLYTLEELAPSLDVVVYDKNTDNQTAKAVLDNSLLALDPEAEKYAGVTYIADNSDYNTAGFDTNANLEFVWIANGVSVNTGTGTGGGAADPSDCATIVFYDWDDTLLGSIVVVKNEDATALVDEFVKSLQSPESKDVDESKSSYFVDDANYPMTYKKGYSFEGCWLPYDSETPTVYGTRVDAINANTLTTPERPVSEEVDLTNITENLVVKAAYNENEELAKDSAVNRRYTATAADYTRFGVTPNYGITVEVRRENASGNGAPRIVSPALRVTMASSAGNIVTLIPLDSSDVTTAQIVPNASVTRVTWTVVETYENQNWVAAGARAANANSAAGTMNVQDSGFLYLCTLGGINDMLEEYTLTQKTQVYNYINMNSLTGIGLTVGSNNITQAKTKLLTAWKTKNSVTGSDGESTIKPESERVGLTFDEMNTALAMQD